MSYRNSRKYENQCLQLARARAAKERKRLEDAEPRPAPLPDKRITIEITRHDCGGESHVFELFSTNRIDVYRVEVDGKPWKRCGLSQVLEGIRKATPRMVAELC